MEEKRAVSPVSHPPVSGSSSHADEPTRVATGAVSGAAPPPRIPGYEIHGEIHRGGQGVVFLATQHGTKRRVALKVLLEGPYASQTARLRFEREIELAASLHHPHIVTILESGVAQGRYFFAMDYIEGQRLDHYVNQRKLTLIQTLELLVKICDAVNFAHLRGVIHRDLKPSNILVTSDGEPRVFDFGLAKSAGASDARETTVQVLSTTGQLVGTLAYMSPEQAAGAQDVDVRTDVYSLGVIAYELLLGTLPYSVAGPLAETLRRISADDPTPPRLLRKLSRFGKGIDDEIETILLRALEKEPPRRYQTAGELGADLRRYLGGEPIEAKRASGFYVLRKTLRRYWVQAGAAAAMLLMLIVFTGILAVQYRQERLLRQESERLKIEAQDNLTLAEQHARQADQASRAERDARQRAETAASAARRAAAELRIALTEQKLQQGELAWLRDDRAEARRSLWSAYLDAPDDPATRWALRRYYLESGELNARQVAISVTGPIALSSNERFAAVAVSGDEVELIDLNEERTSRRIYSPEPPDWCFATNEGGLLLAGAGWARLSLGDASQPPITLTWPGRAAPGGAWPAPDNQTLVVNLGERIEAIRLTDGESVWRRRLPGLVTGRPAISPDERRVALPTDGGLWVVDLLNGDLTLALDTGARESVFPPAVSFLDADRLMITAGWVTVVDLRSPGRQSRVVRLRGEPTHVAPLDERTLAVADTDGYVTILSPQGQVRRWRAANTSLLELRWTDDGVLTLDRSGRMTTWATGATPWITPIESAAPLRAARSRDGRTGLIADSSGKLWVLNATNADQPPSVIALAEPDLFDVLTRRRTPDRYPLAVAGDGSAAAGHDGMRLLTWRTDGAPQGGRWMSDRGQRVTALALDSSGKRMAAAWSGLRGERVTVSIYPFDQVIESLGSGPPSPSAAIELIGSDVLALEFLPGTDELLILRESGGVLRFQAGAERAPGETRDRPTPWYEADSPLSAGALSDDGRLLALAGTDATLRLIDTTTAQELGRIVTAAAAAQLMFEPGGSQIAATIAGRGVEIHETAAPRRVFSWSPPGGTSSLLWLSDGRMIASDGDRSGLIPLARLDELIDAKRGSAVEISVAAALATNDRLGAWAAVQRLAEYSDERIRSAGVAVVAAELRRSERATLPRTLESLVARPDESDAERLALAAYAGGAYGDAQRWFAMAPLPNDPYLAWRRLECRYLLEKPGAAADALLDFHDGNPALLPADGARLMLQAVAALVQAGRLDEAARRLQNFQNAARRSSRGVESATTLAIGRYLIDAAGDQPLSAALQRMLGFFEERWLAYRDDFEFFAGELARSRGRLAEARNHYQSCLDSAPDRWPANWARYRLRLLNEAEGQP